MFCLLSFLQYLFYLFIMQFNWYSGSCKNQLIYACWRRCSYQTLRTESFTFQTLQTSNSSNFKPFKPFKLQTLQTLLNADMSSTMSGCSPKVVIPIEQSFNSTTRNMERFQTLQTLQTSNSSNSSNVSSVTASARSRNGRDSGRMYRVCWGVCRHCRAWRRRVVHWHQTWNVAGSSIYRL